MNVSNRTYKANVHKCFRRLHIRIAGPTAGLG